METPKSKISWVLDVTKIMKLVISDARKINKQKMNNKSLTLEANIK